MAAQVELSGVSIVITGSFNPAIFHPRWLVEKRLIAENAAEDALSKIFVTPELATFTADWLTVQVTLQQAVFSTVEEGREPELRDLFQGVFDLLPETPVDAVGINADAHFRVESQDEWHELGDTFLPKAFWEPMFSAGPWKKRPTGDVVGLRTMTLEVAREDLDGYVRTEVAPSARITPGVYIGINAHFQLSRQENERSNGHQAARIVADNWEATRRLERDLAEQVLAVT